MVFADDLVSIDLGAIAKGYIADRMKEYLKEQGVESAIINLGGNVPVSYTHLSQIQIGQAGSACQGMIRSH